MVMGALATGGASTLENISQIATTVGALGAAGTLAAGFMLYRINRRDEDAAALRATITNSRAHVDRLRSMVGYELADELVNAVVYNQRMAVPLEAILNKYFLPQTTTVKDEELEKQLKQSVGVVTVSINSSIARRYEDATIALFSDSVRYQTTYPGLHRVLRSLAVLYQNVLIAEKRVARDENAWVQMLKDLIEDPNVSIRTLDDLRYQLSRELIGASSYVASEIRKELGDLKEILDLVADAYLVLDESSLTKISRSERGESLQPVSSTKTVTEDLLEAEKALQHLLTRDERLKYREIVTRFDNRHNEGNDGPHGPP